MANESGNGLMPAASSPGWISVARPGAHSSMSFSVKSGAESAIAVLRPGQFVEQRVQPSLGAADVTGASVVAGGSQVRQCEADSAVQQHRHLARQRETPPRKFGGGAVWTQSYCEQ